MSAVPKYAPSEGSNAVRAAFDNATPAAPSARAVTIGELLALNLPPKEKLLDPWLETQSLNMLAAWRGVGKTHVALGIAFALATGGEFLGWRAPKPKRVLYLDGEMPAHAVQSRLAAIVFASEGADPGDFLRVVTPDLQAPLGSMPDLATLEGQRRVAEAVEWADVVIVDNLSCLVRSGKENEAEGWTPVAEWALFLRASGKSVVFIHHVGKNGAQRGTSKREDLLDTSIELRRPSDYRPDEGARFEIHFTKARALFGLDVKPFEARLEMLPDGSQGWTTRTCDASDEARMIEMMGLGMTQAEVARELDVNRSTVSRTLKAAESAGRYSPPSPKRGNS